MDLIAHTHDGASYVQEVWDLGRTYALTCDPTGYGRISDRAIRQAVRDRRGGARLEECLSSMWPSIALRQELEADIWEWRARGRGREAWLNSLSPWLTEGGESRTWLLALFSVQGTRMGTERRRFVPAKTDDGLVRDVSRGRLGQGGFRCSACGSTIAQDAFGDGRDSGHLVRYCPGCGRPVRWEADDA